MKYLNSSLELTTTLQNKKLWIISLGYTYFDQLYMILHLPSVNNFIFDIIVARFMLWYNGIHQLGPSGNFIYIFGSKNGINNHTHCLVYHMCAYMCICSYIHKLDITSIFANFPIFVFFFTCIYIFFNFHFFIHISRHRNQF